MEVPRISIESAKEKFEAKDTIFLDIRDPNSFQHGHIPGAQHLGDHNVTEYIESADKSKAHVIYCYHGNSSQGGTGYFLENGFSDVQSMDGGFTQWEASYPDLIET